jgi:hypothetical protein
MTSRTDKSSGTSPFSEPRYVWLFQCSNRIALHAATLDRSAGNLPKDVCRGGKWTLSGQLVVRPETKSDTGIDIEALKAGILAGGFYLWNADSEPPPDTLRLMR